MLPYAGDFGTWKCLTGTEAICLEGKRRDPDLVLVFRSLRNQNSRVDGPIGDWEWFNPDVYYAKLKPYLPAGFDYYEVSNEQTGPN